MVKPCAASAIVAGIGLALAGPACSDALRSYNVIGDSIPASLTGARGEATRGRAIVVARQNTCLLCHGGSFAEQTGDLAPGLAGTGSRWSEGQLRLRLVDASRVNPDTIMPSYYKIDGLQRVAATLRDRPILSAEQIEDVVAYLVTLRDGQ